MIASVLIEISNINVDKEFCYYIPDSLVKNVKIGIRVKVPFNNRICEGFVLNIHDSYDGERDKLKEIIEIVDEEPILNDELLLLGRYMSKKYYSTLISCYQTMLPKALKAQNKTHINKKMINYIILNGDLDTDIKLNTSQQKIIDVLSTTPKVEQTVLNQISKSSVQTLLKHNIIKIITEEDYRLKDNVMLKKDNYQLTVEQSKAVKTVLGNNGFPKTFLLHGVTGSGKTLVYLEIVEEMLKRGKESIFLVPEISLTPQMVNKFKERFGDLVAVLHSRLSEGEKYDEYRKVVSGVVKIVVGARSAVFAPFKNLGVIIIDEEHTNTYKQDNNPKYHAIDIAIERSKYHKAMVILGSATPSLESYTKGIKNIYSLVELKNRVNNRKLPDVEIIDMNKEYKKGDFLSQKLIDSINERLAKKEQIILLLNRRGYATFITCSNCGNTIKCPHCDITLTYHKTSNTLRCHYCGYGEKKLDKCLQCGEDSMKNLGLGTEKVEEMLNKLFDARIVRMDLDTTTKKGAHERIINSFKNHEYDILLGTQMIAKGLDFDNVTLVGIINADTSLMIPNYNSSEYTFQLLTQTSGRSGRGEKEGKVIIQTFNPEHYAIKLAQTADYLTFFKKEMNVRHNLSYPPYFFLVYIKIIGKDYDIVSRESNKISHVLKKNLLDSQILGPTPCSVFRINNSFRFGIIIKYKKEKNIDNILHQIIEHYKNNRETKIDIDVNPYNL